MRHITKALVVMVLATGFLLVMTANAHDASEALFMLLDKGGCKPDSLVGRSWTISTSPVGTHGELVLGDTLRFELLEEPAGIANTAEVMVFRNGVPWKNINGWYGRCARDGTISQFVIAGDFDVEGCRHELAVGRLDHDDSLSNKIELVFQDSDLETALECATYTPRHPGHAHGTED